MYRLDYCINIRPSVSILIPTYKRKHFEKLIQYNINNQDYTNIKEVIISLVPIQKIVNNPNRLTITCFNKSSCVSLNSIVIYFVQIFNINIAIPAKYLLLFTELILFIIFFNTLIVLYLYYFFYNMY